MTTTPQTNALRLADRLHFYTTEVNDAYFTCNAPKAELETAAQELRRLDAVEQRHNEMLANPCPEWDNKAYMLALSNQRERIATVEAERDQLRAQVERLQGGEPDVWVRDQRGEYEGPETLDPMFIFGSSNPGTGRHGATYSPRYPAQPAAPALVPWQPIETAPDDTDRPVVVGWIDAEGKEQTNFDYKEDGCWMEWHNNAEYLEMIGAHGFSYTPPYTYWLQVPPLPVGIGQPVGGEKQL